MLWPRVMQLTLPPVARTCLQGSGTMDDYAILDAAAANIFSRVDIAEDACWRPHLSLQFEVSNCPTDTMVRRLVRPRRLDKFDLEVHQVEDTPAWGPVIDYGRLLKRDGDLEAQVWSSLLIRDIAGHNGALEAKARLLGQRLDCYLVKMHKLLAHKWKRNAGRLAIPRLTEATLGRKPCRPMTQAQKWVAQWSALDMWAKDLLRLKQADADAPLLHQMAARAAKKKVCPQNSAAC